MDSRTFRVLWITVLTLLSFVILERTHPANAADVCLTGEGMRPVYNTLFVCGAVVQVFLILVLNALVQAGWSKSYKQSMLMLLIDHYFATPKNGVSRFWFFASAVVIAVCAIWLCQYHNWQRGNTNKPPFAIEQTADGWEAAGLEKIPYNTTGNQRSGS